MNKMRCFGCGVSGEDMYLRVLTRDNKIYLCENCVLVGLENMKIVLSDTGVLKSKFSKKELTSFIREAIKHD